MYSEVFGYRINLIYIAIVVALWDIVHIFNEFHERYTLLVLFESTEFGCLSGFFKHEHCLAILSQIAIYALDFLFCIFLITGAFHMKKIWVLLWIILSSYHLIDFLLYFTPFYGTALSFSFVPLYLWADIGVSTIGLIYVIYFYRKLTDNKIEEIASERLANVEDFNGVEFGAY
ncbi:hypothetical protein PVAND_010371 [Polypedilum vanderplanki]|uniref:Transmembrane protein n=1 Tax=Polypedilum vanderplanki TaxID=319348 RepID=A0A9J6CFP9_POLVA|nr:hypothetical protein PVAND_010371 [Polypedilum vanderplanki]